MSNGRETARTCGRLSKTFRTSQRSKQSLSTLRLWSRSSRFWIRGALNCTLCSLNGEILERRSSQRQGTLLQNFTGVKPYFFLSHIFTIKYENRFASQKMPKTKRKESLSVIMRQSPRTLPVRDSLRVCSCSLEPRFVLLLE